MKLIKFSYCEDYGHNFYLTILRFNEWCVFHGCFYTAMYGRTFPYLNIIVGSSRLLEINFSFFNIGFNLSFFTRWWFNE